MNFVIELLLLLFIAAAGAVGLFTALRRMQPGWSAHLEERRIAILLILVLTLTAIKVGEEVLGAQTTEFDTAVLLYLREHTPPDVVQLFAWITLTGSSMFLTPLIAVVTLWLLYLRRRTEALLLAASGVGGVLVVYLLKRAIGRDRPALWETEIYWGSSFPSGHTLGTAACAMALALCLRRIRPRTQSLGMWLALTWIALVGLSRLILGVHWPTDVMAAACIGLALPLTINLLIDTHRGHRRRRRQKHAQAQTGT